MTEERRYVNMTNELDNEKLGLVRGGNEDAFNYMTNCLICAAERARSDRANKESYFKIAENMILSMYADRELTQEEVLKLCSKLVEFKEIFGIL